MNMQDLRSRVALHHSTNPQKAKLADMAIDAAESALAQLAHLGHNLHLVEGTLAPLAEYPKMLYHSTLGAQVVEDTEGELALVQAGWRDTPSPRPVEAEPLAAPLPPPPPPILTKSLPGVLPATAE